MVTKTATIFLLAGLACAAVLFAQETQQNKKKGPSPANVQVKGRGGCVYLTGTGNLQMVPFGNACAQPRQFTVLWSGGPSPKNVTYRINGFAGGDSAREVWRQDIRGEVISEGP